MEISPLNKRQAESFFKVMLAKKMAPKDIAETLTFCSALFLQYVEAVEAAKKVTVN